MGARGFRLDLPHFVAVPSPFGLLFPDDLAVLRRLGLSPVCSAQVSAWVPDFCYRSDPIRVAFPDMVAVSGWPVWAASCSRVAISLDFARL